jgi:hypothetical protein
MKPDPDPPAPPTLLVPRAFIPWPEAQDDSSPPPQQRPPPPPSSFYLYIFLAVLAAVCGSTGPAWFRLMGGAQTPALVKVFWRMFNTFLAQAPLAAVQMRCHAWDGRVVSQWLAALPRAALPVGTIMGLHFACVAGSSALTSFAHTMSTVNAAPLFFTAFFLLRHALSRQLYAQGSAALLVDAQPPPPLQLPFLHPSRSPLPSPLEALGACLTFCGVCALVSLDGASADQPVTAAGDVLGLGASLFMALYLSGGAYRGAMPLFCWMCPLHGAAALSTGCVALLSGASLGGGPQGLLGCWDGGLATAATAGSVVLPSLVAHSLMNLLTPAERLGPFLVSMFLNLQPLTGNVFGWAIGVQQQPSPLSLLCAPLIVLGTVLATLGRQGRTISGLLQGCSGRATT